jgi:hypothetical protein
VLLRPLPYEDPARLVTLREVWREPAARVPVLAIFVRTAPIDLPRAAEVSLDGRALAAAASLSIASGLLLCGDAAGPVPRPGSSAPRGLAGAENCWWE